MSTLFKNQKGTNYDWKYDKKYNLTKIYFNKNLPTSLNYRYCYLKWGLENQIAICFFTKCYI